MTQKNFLVEIGTEELPPKSLRVLAESFSDNFITELKKANLTHGVVCWLASPRRLALKVANLSMAQVDRVVEKRGPAISQVFDAKGKLSKSAKGWAKNCGITFDQAERLVTHKGEWLMYRAYIKGDPVQPLLAKIVNDSLSRLPIPKLMRWSNSEVQFVRPVHTVTMLLGSELISGSVMEVKSARIVRGHRFIGEAELTLDDADHYIQLLLKRGKVIVDYEARKSLIKHKIKLAATKINGMVDLSENLLEEVTSMVEWPVIFTAKFEDRFLTIPKEALVHTMKCDQKYFPVYDVASGNLLPNFIFVANIESKDPHQIIIGNERVVRARLADAEFFFKADCKKRLEQHLPSLKTVLFQQQLGSMYDKTHRVQTMAGWIAGQIGASVNNAIRAGLLSKCDLMTNMVFGFTDTQGVMGMHYARYDGESEEVAVALSEQYHPRFSGDRLPQSLVACSLAIADKMDTLVGIFGIGKQPTGDKDPFALRRAALGVLRIIIEKSLPLDLKILTEESTMLYASKLTNALVVDEVVKFMLGRLRTWYKEKGYAVDTIQAALACHSTKPIDLHARVKAVSNFRALEVSTVLTLANKRIANILAKSNDTLNNHVQNSLLKEIAEIQLAHYLRVLRNRIEPYFMTNNYYEALIELSTLCDPLNAFFKHVIVMATEDAVRVNRLTLLSKIRQLFLQVADISLLQ